jgi:hypothetical protein
VTKRFFIWLFWYFAASLLLMATWRNDDGTIQIPAWWGAGGLIILFAWWGRYLAVKYPSKHKFIYGVAGAACLLMAISAVFS